MNVQSGEARSFLIEPGFVQFQPGHVVFGNRWAILFLVCADWATLSDDGLDVHSALHPAPALSQGNGYHLAPVYPMLAAGGAVWWEAMICQDNQPAMGVCLALGDLGERFEHLLAMLLIVAELPVAPLSSAWWDSS